MSEYYKFQVNIPSFREKEYKLIKKIMNDLDAFTRHKYESLIIVFNEYAATHKIQSKNVDIDIESEIIEIQEWDLETSITAWDYFKQIGRIPGAEVQLYDLLLECKAEMIPEIEEEKDLMKRKELFRDILYELDKPFKTESESK